MKIVKNKTKFKLEFLENFFYEERIKKYMFKKSRSDKLKFPWDTKAPIVYKYKDQFIKIHGLKSRFHYFTKKARAVLVDKLHNYLNENNIRTIQPNIIAINGKYSLIGTIDIKTLGLKLLSEVDLRLQRETLDKIFNDLFKLKLYHYDNKSTNACISEDGKYYLLDIDSVRKKTLFRNPEWKLKKRSKARHEKKMKKLEKIIQEKDEK